MIYLCRNKRNGFVKIGFSQNPKLREKTLQSEEPEVFFERIYEGTLDQEQQLHVRFSHRRVRGEWFELFAEDVEAIDGLLGDGLNEFREAVRAEFDALLRLLSENDLMAVLAQIPNVRAEVLMGEGIVIYSQSEAWKLHQFQEAAEKWSAGEATDEDQAELRLAVRQIQEPSFPA